MNIYHYCIRTHIDPNGSYRIMDGVLECSHTIRSADDYHKAREEIRSARGFSNVNDFVVTSLSYLGDRT